MRMKIKHIDNAIHNQGISGYIDLEPQWFFYLLYLGGIHQREI